MHMRWGSLRLGLGVLVLSLAGSAGLGGCNSGAKPEDKAERVGEAQGALAVGLGQLAYSTHELGAPGVYLIDKVHGVNAQSTVDVYTQGNQVALGDLDGDGDDDFVIGMASGGVGAFNDTGMLLGFPGLQSYGFPPKSIIGMGDVDHDGFDEVVLGIRDQNGGGALGRITVVSRAGHNAGDIFANGGSDLSGFALGEDFAVCDLDHDGFDDIVVKSFGFHIYSHPSRPAIDVQAYFGATTPAFSQGDRLLCADFNGDRFDDVVIVHPGLTGGTEEGDFNFFTFPGQPAIVYNPTQGQPLFQEGDQIAVGDLDQDGLAEIVTGHLHHQSPSTEPPVFVGPLSVYDNQGRDARAAIFGQGPFPIYGGGDAIAIRRRHLSNASVVDSDGDGFTDAEEGVGPNDGIDGNGDGIPDYLLPNADPQRKDVYVEIDAMACAVAGGDCVGPDLHTHRPIDTDFDPVRAAFTRAGMNLHVVIDEDVPHTNSCCFGTDTSPNATVCTASPYCYQNYRNQSFGTADDRLPANAARLAAKNKAFHYALFAHGIPIAGAAGIAHLGENGFAKSAFMIIEARDSASFNAHQHDMVGSRFMHELGHNLGLRHGGSDDLNFKPNYLSGMNYIYANASPPLVDYSPVKRDSLFETNLDETKGLSAASPLNATWTCTNASILDGSIDGRKSSPASAGLDWNCNTVSTDKNFTSDVNGDRFCIETDSKHKLKSVASPKDVLAGGVIVPGPDGKLYSRTRCNGVAGSDMKVGNFVYPGTDGTIETQLCYELRVVEDPRNDRFVFSVNPGPGRAAVDTPVSPKDEAVLNAAGQVIQILPGPDFILDSCDPRAFMLADRCAPFDATVALYIYGGTDAAGNPDPLDCDYIATGVINPIGVPGDTWLAKVDKTDEGRIDSNSDAQFQTSIAGDDQVFGQFIMDGPDRVCDSTLIGVSADPDSADHPDFVLGRATACPGPDLSACTQPNELTAPSDWDKLLFKINPAVNPLNETVIAEPSNEYFDQLQRRLLQADLGISVSASTSSLKKGDSVTFHVTVSNTGPAAAEPPTVNLTLPSGAVFSQCTSTSSCSVAGSSAILAADSLAPGATLQADFIVQTSCATPSGNLVVNAVVVAETTDVSPLNNGTTSTVSVAASAPVFSFVPADFTTSVCSGVQLGTPLSTDGCGGTVTITNNAPSTFPLGRTLVTWTATSAGGSVTATQAVTAELGDSATCCPVGSHVMLGTPSNDTLNGTTGVDCILGRGGQDRINGNSGDDLISGGAGDDIIDGGAGNDRIYGGTGQDTLTGGAGDDLITGNDGDDIVRGGLGNDTLAGGQGQDQLFGEDNDDTLGGDGGTDTLDGGAGNDYLEGGTGSDTCRGGSGTNLFAACETRPDAPTAADACSNGVKDGKETGTDCGGSGCFACAGGGVCQASGDCLSQVCTGNQCVAPQTTLIGSLTITSDWGAGYCASVNALNIASTATSSWRAFVNPQQSSIYQVTKGTTSGATGLVTITPQADQLVVAPHTQNIQVSFCANRTAGNTTALPSLGGLSGSY